MYHRYTNAELFVIRVLTQFFETFTDQKALEHLDLRPPTERDFDLEQKERMFRISDGSTLPDSCIFKGEVYIRKIAAERWNAAHIKLRFGLRIFEVYYMIAENGSLVISQFKRTEVAEH